ncbi:hypothetical protein [Phenylobacterium sp.]|uniref:hypothetical protein n=1 Tax=Phenylobacterium sp. TaxID=1871053 RepID=UPI002F3E43AA
MERTLSGWVVQGPGRPFGPFHGKANALDLAEGMARAIRAGGGEVDVVVKD